jgi:arylsulfatase A
MCGKLDKCRIVAGLLLLVALGNANLAGQEAKRPNVVLIFADDLGINDLGCYGRLDHNTPNLDKLAKQGIRFTSSYCSQPICSPSRAGILTGIAPARLHLTTFLPGRPDTPAQKLLHPKMQMQLATEQKTLAERFADAGYATACVGKWHLGGAGFGPKDQGFQFVHAGKGNTQPSETEGGKGEYDLTRAAIEFVEANKDKPFFLYLPHNNPHIPLAAKQELIDKNKDAFNPLYAAVVETLDDSVGLLLDKLDELKLTENTIVIFTSDNGGLHVLEFENTPATHNTPFRAGKGYVYEGGLRVPTIVRYPGVTPAGAVSDVPITNLDLTATLSKLCGLEGPKESDGIDISAALRGETLPERTLYWHFPHYTNQGGRPAGAVRQGKWKYVELYDTGESELYDLSTDIGETRNLKDPESLARAQDMKAQLLKWRAVVGAQENTPNPNFDGALFEQLYIMTDPSKFEATRTSAEMERQQKEWRATMNAVVPKNNAKKKK